MTIPTQLSPPDVAKLDQLIIGRELMVTNLEAQIDACLEAGGAADSLSAALERAIAALMRLTVRRENIVIGNQAFRPSQNMLGLS